MCVTTATPDAAAAATQCERERGAGLPEFTLLPRPGTRRSFPWERGGEPRVPASCGRIPRASASRAVGISGGCGAVCAIPLESEELGEKGAVEQRGMVRQGRAGSGDWAGGEQGAGLGGFQSPWADGTNIKKPINCLAPKAMDSLLTWVQDQLDEQTLCPAKVML
ncbi:uncharacterized protein LRP34_004524 [Phaethornis superciliosus]